MKIALGADHAGYSLKECIKGYLTEKGYEIVDCGTDSETSVDYPEYGFCTAKTVMDGKADCGILVCGTGIGISIAANKVKGIRAALCTDSYMAKMAREHNNANILALGARVIGQGVALDIVDAFLTTSFAGWKHARRIDLINEFEKKA
ncbi:ribose 5-phosphate isomerase B [Dehalobacter sp. DCM]|uniref:ribose 5-phosphate isomerase B n=1 Tax=Dehalobacter sp. DCM TaxID=2907827 RepID=UPI0030816A33|nr:ribose 5-phosphate isomerase B [Dehalobacter sp. DCM]